MTIGTKKCSLRFGFEQNQKSLLTLTIVNPPFLIGFYIHPRGLGVLKMRGIYESEIFMVSDHK